MVYSGRMRNLTTVDAAWLAGLFEGEGHIALYPNQGRGAVQLRLDMTDFDVVDAVHRLTGVGRLYTRPARNERWKAQRQWQVARRDDVRAVLTAIRPWLHDRRAARADEALAMLDAADRKALVPAD